MSGKMKLRREREEIVPDKAPEGLKDGGHVYLSCSNCRALLVDIYRTRPHEPHTWQCQATCPWCPPDKNGNPETSFLVKVQGGFHVGGIAVSPKDEPDEDKYKSTVVDKTDITDRFLFTVKKDNERSQPVFRL